MTDKIYCSKGQTQKKYPNYDDGKHFYLNPIVHPHRALKDEYSPKKLGPKLAKFQLRIRDVKARPYIVGCEICVLRSSIIVYIGYFILLLHHRLMRFFSTFSDFLSIKHANFSIFYYRKDGIVIAS